MGEINEQYLKSKEKFRQMMSKNPHRNDLGGPSRRVPPGQHTVNAMVPMPPIRFEHPVVSKEKWELSLYGEIENPATLKWNDFISLPNQNYKIDFHCVTTWSKLDQDFTGIAWPEILALARPKASAKYAIFESYDQYTTNVPLNEMNYDDIFIAFKMDGKDIPPELGGPVRVVIPELYGWKSAKYVHRIRFQEKDEPGFWETRGYHNHADPWKEERFS